MRRFKKETICVGRKMEDGTILPYAYLKDPQTFETPEEAREAADYLNSLGGTMLGTKSPWDVYIMNFEKAPTTPK